MVSENAGVLLSESGLSTVPKLPDLSQADIRRFIQEMQERGTKPVSINGYLRSLKVLFNYLVDEGILSQSPMAKVKMVKVPKVAFPTFEPADLPKLFEAFDRRDFKGVRDYTVTRLLVDTGLRGSEALGIKLEDVNQRERMIKVMGKGSKERVVVYGLRFQKDLLRYLRRGYDDGFRAVGHREGKPFERQREGP